MKARGKREVLKPDESLAGQEAERQVLALFAGRRHSERHAIVRHAEIGNRHRQVRALTIDVSRTGAMFRVVDESFLSQLKGDDLHSFAAHVAEFFSPCLLATLGNGMKRRRMQLVRVTQGGLGLSFIPLIAAKFQVPLSRSECRALGIPEE